MPTLTPTKDTGATAKANEVVYVELDRTETDQGLANQLGLEGVDAAFVADFLSACLTQLRCGVHLYRSVANRSENPELQARYEQLGQDALRQVEVLEDLVTAGGGNASYVSPLARATEAAATKAREATFLGSGGIDPMAAEMAMLDAVLVAETLVAANRTGLRQLDEALPAGAMKDALAPALEGLAPQGDDPVGWAKETRLRLTMLQVDGPAPSDEDSGTDGLVARVKGWLKRGDDAPANRRGEAASKKAVTKKQTASKKSAAKKQAATKKQAASKKSASKKQAAAKKSAASKKSGSAKKRAASKKSGSAKKAATKKSTGAKGSGSAKKASAKKKSGTKKKASKRS